jgi:hypothetical protein
MKPNQYEDETICYKCMFEFAGWDNLGAPWEEHMSQNPNCPFIIKSDASNIDLSGNAHGNVTHFSSFLKRSKLRQRSRLRLECKLYKITRNSYAQGITKIVYLQNSYCVGTMSKEGIVTIWDVISLVKVACSFNPLDGSEGYLHTIELLPSATSLMVFNGNAQG